jgi:hypothetical protein
MKHLSHYLQEKQTALFDKYGVFFAFSHEQFKEQFKEGVKYCSLGPGIICPTENAKYFVAEHAMLVSQALQEDLAENGIEAIIEREYFNFETQIDNDLERVWDTVKDYPIKIEREYFNSICKKCFSKAVENDWF